MARCVCSERETLKRIEEDLKQLLSVRILNGNNTHVTYSRDEFLQMLYDRPRELVKKQFSIVDKLTKVVALVNLVILIYMAVGK